MNPIKSLLSKLFDRTPPAAAKAGNEDVAFEGNPDQETVAPTSVRSSAWKRGDAPAEPPARPSSEEWVKPNLPAARDKSPLVGSPALLRPQGV